MQRKQTKEQRQQSFGVFVLLLPTNWSVFDSLRASLSTFGMFLLPLFFCAAVFATPSLSPPHTKHTTLVATKRSEIEQRGKRKSSNCKKAKALPHLTNTFNHRHKEKEKGATFKLQQSTEAGGCVLKVLFCCVCLVKSKTNKKRTGVCVCVCRAVAAFLLSHFWCRLTCSALVAQVDLIWI